MAGAPPTARNRSIGRWPTHTPPPPSRASPAGRSAGCSSRCPRRSSISTSMARSGSTPRSSWRARAASMRRPSWAGMYDALVAPERCTDQAELLRAFDLPIALMQDAEALERITAELVETQGRRQRPLRRDPLGPAAPRRARAVAGRRDRGGLSRGARGGGPHRHDRAPHLHRAPLARPGRQRGPRRDSGALPRPGPHRLGPRRTGGRLPGPARSRRARSRPRAAGGLRITIHAGEWGGAAQVRRALAVDPERIAHGPRAIDDPELCRGAYRPGHHARPVPDLERPGRDRAVRGGASAGRASTGPASRSRSARTT